MVELQGRVDGDNICFYRRDFKFFVLFKRRSCENQTVTDIPVDGEFVKNQLGMTNGWVLCERDVRCH